MAKYTWFLLAILLCLGHLYRSVTLSLTLPIETATARIDLAADRAPFYHGVASGDPLSDRVILWTRVTPDSAGPVPVQWEMALDPGFTTTLRRGHFRTDESRDYTVKVDVTNLQPDQWYYYRFRALGRYSMVGRTRTTPTDAVDQLRFGVVSCSNFQSGYFNAYRQLANRNDLDAIVHLGDYIYEYKLGGYGYQAGIHREHTPTTDLITLDNYRLRYSQYHLDPDLIRAHQQYPWIIIWDDHETADDAWMGGAANHTAGDGNWENRKQAATRAFLEWLPVRLPEPNRPERIYRTIDWGPLAEWVMLDTRLEGRDAQLGATDPALADTCRRLMSEEQWKWIEGELADSLAPAWSLIGQQVMLAPLEIAGLPLNTDQWDGYPAERERMYRTIAAHPERNFVVLTGDFHSSWANDLPHDPAQTGYASYGVEFVTPSVTSPGGNYWFGEAVAQFENPHCRYVDLTQHGYVVLDVQPHRVQADYFFTDDILSRNDFVTWGTSWQVCPGDRHLLPAVGPNPPRKQLPAPAPEMAPQLPNGQEAEGAPPFIVLGAYSSPIQNRIVFEYFLHSPIEITLELLDPGGECQIRHNWLNLSAGLQYGALDIADFDSGTYTVQVEAGGKKFRQEVKKVDV